MPGSDAILRHTAYLGLRSLSLQRRFVGNAQDLVAIVRLGLG